ncbi:flagellin [Roseovarius ramblicola]|uniref:Flagellin n=1 Tax=Roseovarius ramblicola TaxID=2022336 RepID=A0ABV5HZ71_9RHOB
MALQSIGDLARSFVLRQQGAHLTRETDRLTREVSTGRATDTARHLSGNLLPLADIERALTLADAHREVARIAAVDAGIMQTALGRVEESGRALAVAALATGSAGGAMQPGVIAEAARNALSSMIGALGTGSAGRVLFGGEVTDRAPLADADTLLQELRTVLTAAPDASALRGALDSFFDAADGGFATGIYRGGQGSAAGHALGAGETVALSIRADDAALRGQIKQAAMLSLIDDPALALDPEDRAALARELGTGLLAGQDGVARLRGQLGFAEERIAQAVARIDAETTGLRVARNDLVSVDIFESAAALEQVQTQLETLYTITARTARLNLANFLS